MCDLVCYHDKGIVPKGIVPATDTQDRTVEACFEASDHALLEHGQGFVGFPAGESQMRTTESEQY